MRRLFFILGMVLILTSAVGAQATVAQESAAPENPAFARLLTTPYFTLAPVSGVTAPAPTMPLGLALAPAAPAADPPQNVQGVFVNYNWQAYFGYTFFRFYEVPGNQFDTNGFNYSMQYYIR